MTNIKELINKWGKKTPAINKSSRLRYKVEQTRIDDSNHYFLIQDSVDNSVPDSVTHYLSDYSRNYKSPNTVKNIAYALVYLYSFSKFISVNLNRLILDGKTLELNQITHLRDFIRTRGNPNLQYIKKPTNAELSLKETNRLMGLIKSYLKWGLDTYCSKGCGEKIETLERKFRSLKYNVKRDNTVRVLKKRPVELLTEAFNIGPDSVWNNPINQLRNHCIYGIADETGARIGEIMGLYVGDISTGSYPSINIVKRDENKLDSRKIKTRAKTTSRTISISNALHNKIVEYISVRPGKSRNPFLFLSHKGSTTGRPLSLRSVHSLMEDIDRFYSNNADWEKKINWHDVRHTALYRFYWKFKGRPNQKELLKDIGGHVDDGVFAHYHSLAIAEESQIIHRQLLEEDDVSYPDTSILSGETIREFSLEDFD